MSNTFLSFCLFVLSLLTSSLSWSQKKVDYYCLESYKLSDGDLEKKELISRDYYRNTESSSDNRIILFDENGQVKEAYVSWYDGKSYALSYEIGANSYESSFYFFDSLSNSYWDFSSYDQYSWEVEQVYESDTLNFDKSFILYDSTFSNQLKKKCMEDALNNKSPFNVIQMDIPKEKLEKVWTFYDIILPSEDEDYQYHHMSIDSTWTGEEFMVSHGEGYFSEYQKKNGVKVSKFKSQNWVRETHQGEFLNPIYYSYHEFGEDEQDTTFVINYSIKEKGRKRFIQHINIRYYRKTKGYNQKTVIREVNRIGTPLHIHATLYGLNGEVEERIFDKKEFNKKQKKNKEIPAFKNPLSSKERGYVYWSPGKIRHDKPKDLDKVDWNKDDVKRIRKYSKFVRMDKENNCEIRESIDGGYYTIYYLYFKED